MSKGNGNPFVVSVRGDCDLVYYNFPLSDSELDQIFDDADCNLILITKACIALCREKGLNIELSIPLIDIPAYMSFESVRVDFECDL